MTSKKGEHVPLLSVSVPIIVSALAAVESNNMLSKKVKAWILFVMGLVFLHQVFAGFIYVSKLM